jgi:hypothetical protein
MPYITTHFLAAIYCSRECQIDDWQNHGHKQDCKHMATSALQAEQSGGGKRDMRGAEQHEKNVSMAGNKVFYENIPRILMQAVLQKYDILDCITVIDLIQAPPSVEVKLASVFLDKDMDTGRDEKEHTKRILERNRQNKSLTVACISLGTYSATDAPRAILLKTFPSMAAPHGSWPASQTQLKGETSSMVDEMHPEDRKEQLVNLRRG